MKNKVGIFGASGRMGRQNISSVLAASDLQLSAGFDMNTSVGYGKDAGTLLDGKVSGIIIGNDLPAFVSASDVIVDFSNPFGSIGLLKECVAQKKALVLGTTGFSKEELAMIDDFSKVIPIVMSGNFSTGINVLLGLVKKCSMVLGKEFNIEIMEQHHNQKIDSPSGTAVMLAKAACEGRSLDYDEVVVTGRSGTPGKRTEDEIGVFALRGGSVIGHHSVYLMGPHEKIELTHVAGDRQAFTGGVLTAVRWIGEQSPGLYNMQHVLGI